MWLACNELEISDCSLISDTEENHLNADRIVSVLAQIQRSPLKYMLEAWPIACWCLILLSFWTSDTICQPSTLLGFCKELNNYLEYTVFMNLYHNHNMFWFTLCNILSAAVNRWFCNTLRIKIKWNVIDPSYVWTAFYI